MEAVRGKSLSQIKYPPTRLKSGRRRFRADISSCNLASSFLILLKTQDQYQCLATKFLLWPDVVRREHGIFLHRQAIEDSFNILRIDILSALGDDHVFLAAEELQMAAAFEAAQIARQKPTVNYGFQSQSRDRRDSAT